VTDATASKVRWEFLRDLPSVAFAPPEESVAAVNLCAKACLPLSVDAAQSAKFAVERFATEFWKMPPPTRRARWDELSHAATPGPGAARLRELEPGLDVVVTSHPNPLVDEVASIVREWFTLESRTRAIRIAEFLAVAADRARAWEDAAHGLRADQPEMAKLATGLLERVVRDSAKPLDSGADSDQLAEERDRVRAMRIMLWGIAFILIILITGVGLRDWDSFRAYYESQDRGFFGPHERLGTSK
jgi:hypothetical protein